MKQSNRSRVVNAFEQVDRRDFVGRNEATAAMLDQPLPIGHGQTISQPTTVAMMLEWLDPQPGERVLDVGSGSGWTTALLAAMVGGRGSVIGVERVPELIRFGRENLAKYGFSQARIEPAAERVGWPSEAPYDRILVSAAASEVPSELVNQLKPGGRMVVPVRGSVHVIDQDKRSRLRETVHPGFAFVPLIE